MFLLNQPDTCRITKLRPLACLDRCQNNAYKAKYNQREKQQDSNPYETQQETNGGIDQKADLEVKRLLPLIIDKSAILPLDKPEYQSPDQSGGRNRNDYAT